VWVQSMMLQTLFLLFPIAWAISCWQLRAHGGDLAVVGVWLGWIALIVVFGKRRQAPPVAENPNRILELAGKVNMAQFTFLESATREQVPVFADLPLALYSVEKPVPNWVGHHVMVGKLDGDDVVLLDHNTNLSAHAPSYETLVVFPN